MGFKRRKIPKNFFSGNPFWTPGASKNNRKKIKKSSIRYNTDGIFDFSLAANSSALC
jgi:hypothetical protein